MHDGKTNCYKFVKDGVKHTLVPIGKEDTAEASGTKALLVGGKQFIKQIEENEVNYAVVRKTKIVLLNTETYELPIEIQKMLEEFKDIVVDDLLDKLPPKTSINHHIDFIPGASLPKKAAYRMSPKDNEEIRKQVQELLASLLLVAVLPLPQDYPRPMPFPRPLLLFCFLLIFSSTFTAL